MVTVVMGVSGCGKTTVGRLLGERLGVPFYDADEFHPAANVAKMAAGIPLNDTDRFPWLRDIAAHIVGWEEKGGAVLACSALKESYRAILSERAPGKVLFVHLQGTMKCIAERMKNRASHYMPLSLLESQFAALEPPRDAITISIDEPPETIVETIFQSLKVIL